MEHKTTEAEWFAYCVDCDEGVTVEWTSDGRLRLMMGYPADKG